jgi:hypothetical protein
MSEKFIETMARLASEMIKTVPVCADDPAARKGLNALIMTLCRNMEDVVPRNVSVKAAARGRELGVQDLRKFHFDHGGKIPGGRKKSMLHWEHWMPVAEMKKELLELVNPTPEECRKVLSKARICWILKGENDELDRRGFKSVRPDPESAYKIAGIEFEYDW